VNSHLLEDQAFNTAHSARETQKLRKTDPCTKSISIYGALALIVG
jgi:hypothetical protein